MQEFLKWTLKTIREEGSMMSWMEEKRFEWVPLATSTLKSLLDGHTLIMITDKDREWFCRYALHTVNKPNSNRPLLPFVPLGAIYPFMDSIKNNEDITILEDMLMLSYPKGYTFFYVGKSDDLRAQIAKRRDDSFMWIMDEQIQNSFYLNSNDELLDIKLIQLFKLFDKSINALLFAEVDLDE
jgi:hypothetical protein